MTLAILPLLMLAVLLNTSAQLALKAGMSAMGQFEFNFANLISIGLNAAMNPFILFGLFCYVISVGVWLLVLSRVDVSVAYPMTSLAFVANAIAAYYLFHEHISLMRFIGIFIILAGVFIVAKS